MLCFLFCELIVSGSKWALGLVMGSTQIGFTPNLTEEQKLGIYKPESPYFSLILKREI